MLPLLFVALVCAGNLKDVYCRPLLETKRALKNDWLIKAVHYMEENPETLEELMDKNYDLAEGDMVLLFVDSLEKLSAEPLNMMSDRNAAGSSWPTLEIPYVISTDLASRTGDVLSAMEMVSEHTCLSFHKRTIEQNYLLFKSSTGCASYVGFKGGEQPVFVGPQCIVGNIAHEILHALGFHHEHTRMDREQYIIIIHSNIMPGMEKNFRTHEGETFSLPYDITSIMHYGRDFFSANSLPTILPKQDVKEMGQREKLTKTDIERVRRRYSCDSLKHTEGESLGM